MSAVIWLFCVGWQTRYQINSAGQQEMIVHIQLQESDLVWSVADSFRIGQYEVQLSVFDTKGNQLAGDYWIREVVQGISSLDDSFRLAIPLQSGKYRLCVVDLQAHGVLKVEEKITLSPYVSNLRWWLIGDSLLVQFMVVNDSGKVDRIQVSLDEMTKPLAVVPGRYPDSLHFMTAGMANGEYRLRLVAEGAGRRLDVMDRQVTIARPFYLDDVSWNLKVDQLEYIATPYEIGIMKDAPKAARDSVWQAFWKPLDPIPLTQVNEKEREYFGRIAYAEQHYAFGDKGWRSDRGKIYVRLGAPDEVQTMPYELGTWPYEVWLYYKQNVKFTFYDRFGFGEYQLLYPEGERI